MVRLSHCIVETAVEGWGFRQKGYIHLQSALVQHVEPAFPLAAFEVKAASKREHRRLLRDEQLLLRHRRRFASFTQEVDLPFQIGTAFPYVENNDPPSGVEWRGAPKN